MRHIITHAHHVWGLFSVLWSNSIYRSGDSPGWPNYVIKMTWRVQSGNHLAGAILNGVQSGNHGDRPVLDAGALPDLKRLENHHKRPRHNPDAKSNSTYFGHDRHFNDRSHTTLSGGNVVR